MTKRRVTEAEKEASRWIARLEASDVSLADHDQFRVWLDASAENRAAYEAVNRTWDKLDGLRALPAEALRRPAASPSPLLSRRALFISGASAGAAVLGVGAGLWIAGSVPSFAARYETPVGGRQSASLADGSHVELNADTALNAAYTKRQRRIVMDRGEAYFTVADDPRPFEVETPFGSFFAYAGAFLIKLGPERVRASVFAGALSARPGGAGEVSGASRTDIVLTHARARLMDVAPDAQAQRLAWRDHMLSFNGETLAEAAADVTRQTGMRFVFADAAIAELRVGGYVDARTAEPFITLVETNLSLRAERHGANETVFSAPDMR